MKVITRLVQTVEGWRLLPVASLGAGIVKLPQ